MHRVTMAVWAVAAGAVAYRSGFHIAPPDLLQITLGGFLGVWSLSRVQRWWGE